MSGRGPSAGTDQAGTDQQPDRAETDLAARLAIVVGGVNRRLRPSSEGLTHMALSALASIGRAGAIRPGDLARIEGVQAPGMTRLVAELERGGLVRREHDPEDGRAIRIRITDEGLAAVAEARASRARRVQSLIACCTAAERGELERAVGVLETALQRTSGAARQR